MIKFESKSIKREFNIFEGSLYSTRIKNRRSGMSFIPDGSGCEFSIKFKDGDEFSSKGLAIAEAVEKDDKLFFRFKEEMNTTVSLNYRIGKDGETIEKQLAIIQSEPKEIDYIVLEDIGIINSTSSFSVCGGKSEIDEFYSNLGQPFYIDSLFFGCLFPATKNGIFHGRGQVIYYLGKSATEKLLCPTTIVGAAKDSTLAELKKAFFDYIEKIAVPSDFKLLYNTWYDRMMDIDANIVQKTFYKIEKQLSSHGVAPLEGYVIDDGWNNYKGDFWNFNQKRFPNGLLDLSYTAKNLSSSFGLWLGPRGGYSNNTKSFAKKIEKGGYGYFNAQANDICVGSEKYLKGLKNFFIKTARENNINYWKIDGFCLTPCLNKNHDHITGGENEMYFITELWERWVDIFKAMRKDREKQGKELWINITCYAFPSPFWLQYVNSVWLQNCDDIGFAGNYPKGGQSQADSEITYRDGIYYDFIFTRALQFPLSHIYNHEPIYGVEAKLDYSDNDFEKAFFWNACRGAALNELYISESLMNEEKWRSLAKIVNWQRENWHILKNAVFLGGNPTENNVYCYASWTAEGEGIIALRNPTNEAAPLTLTLNKLMGCPENLKNVRRFNVYNMNGAESSDVYSYNNQINLTLNPFEIKIFQFGKEDCRYNENSVGNDFTIRFDTDGNDGVICRNEDIEIKIENGYVIAEIGNLTVKSESIIRSSNHRITIVREKNKMVKIYIDKHLDCSGYDEKMKQKISSKLISSSEGFRVTDSAVAYDKIIELKELLKSKRRKRNN